MSVSYITDRYDLCSIYCCMFSISFQHKRIW